MHKIGIGIIVLLCCSPVFGQEYTYAPVDSLNKMSLARLDSLYPSAFSVDSSTNLSGISRSEFDSVFIGAVRPIIHTLLG